MRHTLLLLACVVSTASLADEGMWTFDHFPSAAVEASHGFAPDADWLARVRDASVRLNVGCSGGFVSAEGLVLTNHHCVDGCLADLSTAERDLLTDGFAAEGRTAELACPGMAVDRLEEIRDVTAEVRTATAGRDGAAYAGALRSVTARLEGDCQTSDSMRCSLVTLYGGGAHHLYVYRRWNDVRVVFAPESAAASFGGDPDNFQFPRYCFDVAFLRVWEDGKPARPGAWFERAAVGAEEGGLTFVSGSPGGTSRSETVVELEYERDRGLPEALMRLAESRGLLHEFAKRGAEARLFAEERLLLVENSFKAFRGMHEALSDPVFFRTKVREEEEFRARMSADPARFSAWAAAWDEMERAVARRRALDERHTFLEGGSAFATTYFDWARTLVRAAEERDKPNEERLPEFAEARWDGLRNDLLALRPVFDELEIATLARSLERLRERLGPDDAFVREVLGSRAPADLAREWIEGSGLDDRGERARLLEGGREAVAASRDPMIALARRVDGRSRTVRARWEAEVDGPERRASEALAQARFAAFGDARSPDATFSPRLSFGTVRGWAEGPAAVAPFTRIAGAFGRHTGTDPFSLPPAWMAAKERLDGRTPFNFVTDNDIIGGNSGSPVLDRHGRFVGVAFDGNIHSLGGEYGFDPRNNRMVALDARAIVEVLREVYGARALLSELGWSDGPRAEADGSR